jgi:hypothetical protein
MCRRSLGRAARQPPTGAVEASGAVGSGAVGGTGSAWGAAGACAPEASASAGAGAPASAGSWTRGWSSGCPCRRRSRPWAAWARGGPACRPGCAAGRRPGAWPGAAGARGPAPDRCRGRGWSRRRGCARRGRSGPGGAAALTAAARPRAAIGGRRLGGVRARRLRVARAGRDGDRRRVALRGRGRVVLIGQVDADGVVRRGDRVGQRDAGGGEAGRKRDDRQARGQRGAPRAAARPPRRGNEVRGHSLRLARRGGHRRHVSCRHGLIDRPDVGPADRLGEAGVDVGGIAGRHWRGDGLGWDRLSRQSPRPPQGYGPRRRMF